MYTVVRVVHCVICTTVDVMVSVMVIVVAASASRCLGLQELTIKLNRIMKQLEANQAAIQSLQKALQHNTKPNGSASNSS